VWQQTYSTAAYLGILLSYSGHLAFPPPDAQGLFGCTHAIDTSYDGFITMRYLSELRLATRVRPQAAIATGR
jgi:hypothetical protein